MDQLSPTQFILWIFMLEILSVPVIAFLSSWIINMIYTKKYELIMNIVEPIINSVKGHKSDEQEKDNDL